MWKQNYAPQTKILPFWTAEQSFAYAFLNEFSISGSPKLVLTPLKSTSTTHTQRFVRPTAALFGRPKSSFGEHKNLRDFMRPKRRFWKAEQKMKSGFSTDFSMVRSPNRVLTPLKSASFEIRISSFVHPSQIFVWEG